MFTWSNNQENPILKKLDRVLVTKEWEDIFPQASVSRLPREVSDHNPFIISIGKRFDLGWIKNPDFFHLLKKFGQSHAKLDQLLIRYNRSSSYSNNFFKVGVSFSRGDEEKKGKNFKKSWLN